MKPPPSGTSGSARVAALLLAAALAAAGAYAAWRAFGVVAVEVETPTRGPAVRAVYATGTVEPTVMLPIAPRVAGRIVELRVDEGATVTKDQVLARLEDADLERTVEELDARSEFAKDSYERTRTLFQRGLAPAIDRDRAESEWQAAKAAAARAQALREFMWLRAPADGRILRRDGEVGQLIPVNQPVFYLSRSEGLRISAQVDEEDIALVEPGQRVLIRADAFPDRMFDGRVSEITPMGDPVTRTYRVRIELGPHTPLRIGMTTDTNIVVEERRDALLVPATAVRGDRAWIVRDTRLVEREVRTGIDGGLKVEVLSGIEPDDLVVTLPRSGFSDGMRVRAQHAEPVRQVEE